VIKPWGSKTLNPPLDTPLPISTYLIGEIGVINCERLYDGSIYNMIIQSYNLSLFCFNFLGGGINKFLYFAPPNEIQVGSIGRSNSGLY
jgi:hypothetical protein